MNALLDSLKTGFDALSPTLISAGELGDGRRSALTAALADGLPSTRNEHWKYTALRALSNRSFAIQAQTPQLHPALLVDIPSPRLVFVNGQFDPMLSAFDALENGLSVQLLSHALTANDAQLVNVLNQRLEQANETFARLNTALAMEGVLIEVAANAEIATPLNLVFIGAPASADLALHLRHSIELHENARLTVIEHHLATGMHRHLSNQLLRIYLKPGAHLTHTRVQDEDGDASVIARTDAVLAAKANYRRVDLELGAALSRHELNVSLQGDAAQFTSSGVLLASGRRHVDTRLAVDHAARDTTCDLLWRGLAADRGRAVFYGGITIHEGADGAIAALSNKNILLSDNAEIDTQPVLEIYADEVKASHGATVGRLDVGKLFYLRTRGIPEMQARALLTLAFAREALERLENIALIEQLSPRLETRLESLEARAS